MSYIDSSDSQFVVFFPSDKTIHILHKNRLNFQDDKEDGSVIVMWPIEDLEEDGTMKVKEIPYNGYVVFSGSTAKCRGFMEKINLEESGAKNINDMVKVMRDLSNEIRSSGKRGASLKLKRVLTEEKKDENPKKRKYTKCATSPKKENKKPIKINSLKLKEIEAFAGIETNPGSEKGSPIKTSEKESIQLSPNKEKMSPTKQAEKTSKTEPPAIRSPQRNATKQKKEIAKQAPTKESPNKKNEKTPSKKTRKSPIRSPKKTELLELTSISPTKAKRTPIKQPGQTTEGLRSPKKRTPIKQPGQTTEGSRSPTVKSPNKKSAMNLPTSSVVAQGLGILNLEAESGANFLSSEQEYNFQETCQPMFCSTPVSEFDQESEKLPFTSGSTYNTTSFAEYGYNFNVNTHNKSPLENLIDYYRNLNQDQQANILSFMHLMTNALQEHTYGTNSSVLSSSTQFIPQTDTPCEQDTSTSISMKAKESYTETEMRKMPFINDEKNSYSDVLVNPSQLRTAEMKAMTTSVSKNGGIYLLNKIVELVFTREELATSKGVKGLNQHKLEAIHEYMHTKCKKLNLEPVPPKMFNKTIQNKIGNIRFEKKEKAKLKCVAYDA